MECERAREAVSALIDGEDPGVPAGALEAHLADCAACRGWRQRAHVMTRRARLGGSFLDHDLSGQVLAAIPPAPARQRLRLGLRAALLAVAAGQLAVTVPLLMLGHDQDAGTHAAHELGSFDLALAIAFAVGAIRPALSAGLAWTCAIAAGGLAGTAIADLIGGQAIGADEAQHLIAVAGAALLIWQARTAGPGIAGAGAGADATDWPQAAPSAGAAEPGSVSQLAGRPPIPGDGAARVAAAGTARVARGGRRADEAAGAGTAQGGGGAQPGRDGDGREAVA